jgi:N6-L-threonylcarbamoyladenine synthase
VSGPLILAIESSCDETGIALVEGGRRIHANVVASQVALHAPTGGIVPEVAARAHLRWIVPVLDDAWAAAGVGWADIDAIGVTYGPGLAGSLLVGINFAKALAYVRRKPLVGVNHLEGHVYAAWLLDPGEPERPEPVFPLVALVVSGGHTFLVEMRDHLTYRLLGQTVDDAAGEAFDKVGRLLGLGYPGGPAIARAAEAAIARDRVFPRAWLGDSFDLSFSGLKTAARRIVDQARADAGLAADPQVPLPEPLVAELAWGFQDAVVDVLATKTIRAARATGARSIVLGGGVAANSALRARLAGEVEALGIPLVIPRPSLCTDNGAMIGAAGARRFSAGERSGLDLDARPSLPLAVRSAPVVAR